MAVDRLDLPAGQLRGVLVSADAEKVIALLTEMNAVQTRTDKLGGREIAWHYWRGEVAKALGLPPDTWDEDSDNA